MPGSKSFWLQADKGAENAQTCRSVAALPGFLSPAESISCVFAAPDFPQALCYLDFSLLSLVCSGLCPLSVYFLVPVGSWPLCYLLPFCTFTALGKQLNCKGNSHPLTELVNTGRGASENRLPKLRYFICSFFRLVMTLFWCSKESLPSWNVMAMTSFSQPQFYSL